MKLESQVSSLDLSKKLKKLGVVQGSAFYWIPRYEMFFGRKPKDLKPIGFEIKAAQLSKYFGAESDKAAAFTVAELGEMFGEHVFSEYEHDLSLPWKCTFDEGWMKPKRFEYSDTEADARAKMLVYLLENKIITVEEVNTRLKDEGREGN